MKNLTLGVIAIIAVFAAQSFAGAFTAPTGYPTKTVVQNTKAAFSQTGIDSTTLFLNEPIDPTAVYAISFSDSVAAADTARISVRIYNSSGVLTYSYDTDTLRLADTYKTIALPINKTQFGSTVTVKLVGMVAVVVRKVRSCLLLKSVPIQPYEANKTR